MSEYSYSPPETDPDELTPLSDNAHVSVSNYQQKKGKVKHPVRTVVLVLLVCIVIAGLVGGAYWYTKHKKHVTTPATTTTQPTINVSPATNSTLQAYTSNQSNLNLSFMYPSTWSVSPPSGNSKAQPITATSSVIQLSGVGMTNVAGKVVVSIRPGTDPLNELTSNTVTAAQDSTQIAYSQPTASQQQYPFLTFLHLSGTPNTASNFQEVMITGVTQFKKGDPITPGSLNGLDPIISASFYSCTKTDCTGPDITNLSIDNMAWQNNTTYLQVLSLFKSLKLN